MTLLGNSLRQTVHAHCASVHQAANLVAALLWVARVTAGLAESNGRLLPGLWLMSPAGWLPRNGISSGTLCLVIEYGLPLPFSCWSLRITMKSNQKCLQFLFRLLSVSCYKLLWFSCRLAATVYPSKLLFMLIHWYNVMHSWSICTTGHWSSLFCCVVVWLNGLSL